MCLTLFEQEAARRYHNAFCARLAAEIRANGGTVDDQLTFSLARAARRWERTRNALGSPVPAGLLAVMTSVSLLA